ncbi:MAG: Aldehyde dehydrogenase [Chloroflexi bacterium ADurb.Bin344]|nr:MAG: Aldehyde dehydrogenase [Chloroflexi bacterium ADurb.Bin344]
MDEIKTIVDTQRRFFLSGKTLPVSQRKKALQSLLTMVDENQQKIFDALFTDLHKSEFESYMTEIGLVLTEIRQAMKNLDAWTSVKKVRTPLYLFPSKSSVYPEPYGTVLIMAPWNYPFQLCLVPLIGALAAGNTAVLKPSAYAPAVSRCIAELIDRYFPSEYIAVTEGGREENRSLLEQHFDLIFFTGGSRMGKIVMESAAKNLTPVILELGGKSPCIVDQTADLKNASRKIVFGKLLNAGQTCVAPDYLLVHESVKDTLIHNLIEEFDKAFPDKDYSDFPAIINEKHFDRLNRLIRDENVIYGGNSNRDRRFFEPTILFPVQWETPVMQEEIFGPVLPVLTYEDLDDVIDRLRKLPKPLALYLFTEDRKTEKKIIENVAFGGGCMNDTVMHLSNPNLGFGGIGESGMGQYHGKNSFDSFTHYKSIVKTPV